MNGWHFKYFGVVFILVVIWFFVYLNLETLSAWLTFDLLNLSKSTHYGSAIEFFIYDTLKILLLLIVLIYALAWLRATLNVEKVRDILAKLGRGTGYFLGALFGSITPFCSCSSIPLFLGFTSARIPFGITMAFLITSPIINEIAVVLLWGIIGWKFTIIYVLTGLTAGILGGFFMDAISAQRWLQPYFLDMIRNAPRCQCGCSGNQKLSVQQRHIFAFSETRSIFRRVWKWVVLGVAAGAALHGYVPDDWFAVYFGAGQWWTVPAAVLVAIPLYSNVTGIVPVMESLLLKGLPAGTTLAFCMSAVAASIPEIIMLRQIMTLKLQGVFIGYLWVVFTIAGWLFNALSPALR